MRLGVIGMFVFLVGCGGADIAADSNVLGDQQVEILDDDSTVSTLTNADGLSERDQEKVFNYTRNAVIESFESDVLIDDQIATNVLFDLSDETVSCVTSDLLEGADQEAILTAVNTGRQVKDEFFSVESLSIQSGELVIDCMSDEEVIQSLVATGPAEDQVRCLVEAVERDVFFEGDAATIGANLREQAPNCFE